MDNKHIRLNNYLFSILIGIIFLLTPLLFFANSSNYYIYRFEHYGVYEEFKEGSINKETVDSQLQNLIHYLSPYSKPLDFNFYSNEDILHLYDVKNILNVLYYIYGISIFATYLILRYKKKYINFEKINKFCRFYILVTILVFTLVILNFSFLFTLAHEMTFSNDYWLLDPSSSNLIKFFPQSLFFEVFLLVIITNLLLHISFIMLSNKINGKRKSK